ncbi:MAG TPA: hypothetical protein VHC96_11345 [Puia sp.]|nr:hypothetical protein [Puia sp.]
MTYLLFPAFILLTISGFSQGLGSLENNLLQKFNQIEHWSRDSVTPGKYDSLQYANKVFQKTLFHYASTNPNTIHATFTQLKNAGLTIATSSDGLFRIYSWDTQTGGTMRFFSNVYQYKDEHGVYARADPQHTGDDAGAFYSDIYRLPANGKIYYLAIYHAILSTKDCMQGIQTFSIRGHSLDDSVRIIKTSKGLANGIDFEYDFFSVVSRPERPVHLIDYDSAKRIIRIPVVTDDGAVTKRSILYRFTGQYFQHISQSPE